MEKDFLKKYEDEINTITNQLIDTKKKWECRRINDIWKEFLDEICKCNLDMSLCDEAGYLPVHVLSRHLKEEDIYEHLLFIFNLKTSEILFFLVSDTARIIDMNKVNKKINKLLCEKKLKKFFLAMVQNDVDILPLLNVAEKISKNINALNIEFHKKYIEDINTLFSIIDKKEIMTLFGYCLYVYFYKQFTLSYKYYSMLNIVFNPKNYDINKLRAVCSLLYSLIFSEEEIPSENIFTIDDIKTEDDVLKRFKKQKNLNAHFIV